MAEYRIVCVERDRNGVITNVRLDNGQTYPKMTIINAIGADTFYTMRNGYRAAVYRRQHYITREWFLTTNPDATTENNLDFLDCN